MAGYTPLDPVALGVLPPVQAPQSGTPLPPSPLSPKAVLDQEIDKPTSVDAGAGPVMGKPKPYNPAQDLAARGLKFRPDVGLYREVTQKDGTKLITSPAGYVWKGDGDEGAVKGRGWYRVVDGLLTEQKVDSPITQKAELVQLADGSVTMKVGDSVWMNTKQGATHGPGFYKADSLGPDSRPRSRTARFLAATGHAAGVVGDVAAAGGRELYSLAKGMTGATVDTAAALGNLIYGDHKIGTTVDKFVNSRAGEFNLGALNAAQKVMGFDYLRSAVPNDHERAAQSIMRYYLQDQPAGTNLIPTAYLQGLADRKIGGPEDVDPIEASQVAKEILQAFPQKVTVRGAETGQMPGVNVHDMHLYMDALGRLADTKLAGDHLTTIQNTLAEARMDDLRNDFDDLALAAGKIQRRPEKELMANPEYVENLKQLIKLKTESANLMPDAQEAAAKKVLDLSYKLQRMSVAPDSVALFDQLYSKNGEAGRLKAQIKELIPQTRNGNARLQDFQEVLKGDAAKAGGFAYDAAAMALGTTVLTPSGVLAKVGNGMLGKIGMGAARTAAQSLAFRAPNLPNEVLGSVQAGEGVGGVLKDLALRTGLDMAMFSEKLAKVGIPGNSLKTVMANKALRASALTFLSATADAIKTGTADPEQIGRTWAHFLAYEAKAGFDQAKGIEGRNVVLQKYADMESAKTLTQEAVSKSIGDLMQTRIMASLDPKNSALEERLKTGQAELEQAIKDQVAVASMEHLPRMKWTGKLKVEPKAGEPVPAPAPEPAPAPATPEPVKAAEPAPQPAPAEPKKSPMQQSKPAAPATAPAPVAGTEGMARAEFTPEQQEAVEQRTSIRQAHPEIFKVLEDPKVSDEAFLNASSQLDAILPEGTKWDVDAATHRVRFVRNVGGKNKPMGTDAPAPVAPSAPAPEPAPSPAPAVAAPSSSPTPEPVAAPAPKSFSAPKPLPVVAGPSSADREVFAREDAQRASTQQEINRNRAESIKVLQSLKPGDSVIDDRGDRYLFVQEPAISDGVAKAYLQPVDETGKLTGYGIHIESPDAIRLIARASVDRKAQESSPAPGERPLAEGESLKPGMQVRMADGALGTVGKDGRIRSRRGTMLKKANVKAVLEAQPAPAAGPVAVPPAEPAHPQPISIEPARKPAMKVAAEDQEAANRIASFMDLIPEEMVGPNLYSPGQPQGETIKDTTDLLAALRAQAGTKATPEAGKRQQNLPGETERDASGAEKPRVVTQDTFHSWLSAAQDNAGSLMEYLTGNAGGPLGEVGRAYDALNKHDRKIRDLDDAMDAQAKGRKLAPESEVPESTEALFPLTPGKHQALLHLPGVESVDVSASRMRVLNQHNEKPKEGDIKIDRSGRWGNPFPVKEKTEAGLLASLKQYVPWLNEQIRTGKITLEDLDSLYGHNLACWDYPNNCHGNYLREWAIWAHHQLERRNAIAMASRPTEELKAEREALWAQRPDVVKKVKAAQASVAAMKSAGKITPPDRHLYLDRIHGMLSALRDVYPALDEKQQGVVRAFAPKVDEMIKRLATGAVVTNKDWANFQKGVLGLTGTGDLDLMEQSLRVSGPRETGRDPESPEKGYSIHEGERLRSAGRISFTDPKMHRLLVLHEVGTSIARLQSSINGTDKVLAEERAQLATFEAKKPKPLAEGEVPPAPKPQMPSDAERFKAEWKPARMGGEEDPERINLYNLRNKLAEVNRRLEKTPKAKGLLSQRAFLERAVLEAEGGEPSPKKIRTQAPPQAPEDLDIIGKAAKTQANIKRLEDHRAGLQKELDVMRGVWGKGDPDAIVSAWNEHVRNNPMVMTRGEHEIPWAHNGEQAVPLPFDADLQIWDPATKKRGSVSTYSTGRRWQDGMHLGGKFYSPYAWKAGLQDKLERIQNEVHPSGKTWGELFGRVPMKTIEGVNGPFEVPEKVVKVETETREPYTRKRAEQSSSGRIVGIGRTPEERQIDAERKFSELQKRVNQSANLPPLKHPEVGEDVRLQVENLRIPFFPEKDVEEKDASGKVVLDEAGNPRMVPEDSVLGRLEKAGFVLVPGSPQFEAHVIRPDGTRVDLNRPKGARILRESHLETIFGNKLDPEILLPEKALASAKDSSSYKDLISAAMATTAREVGVRKTTDKDVNRMNTPEEDTLAILRGIQTTDAVHDELRKRLVDARHLRNDRQTMIEGLYKRGVLKASDFVTAEDSARSLSRRTREAFMDLSPVAQEAFQKAMAEAQANPDNALVNAHPDGAWTRPLESVVSAYIQKHGLSEEGIRKVSSLLEDETFKESSSTDRAKAVMDAAGITFEDLGMQTPVVPNPKPEPIPVGFVESNRRRRGEVDERGHVNPIGDGSSVEPETARSLENLRAVRAKEGWEMVPLADQGAGSTLSDLRLLVGKRVLNEALDKVRETPGLSERDQEVLGDLRTRAALTPGEELVEHLARKSGAKFGETMRFMTEGGWAESLTPAHQRALLRGPQHPLFQEADRIVSGIERPQIDPNNPQHDFSEESLGRVYRTAEGDEVTPENLPTYLDDFYPHETVDESITRGREIYRKLFKESEEGLAKRIWIERMRTEDPKQLAQYRKKIKVVLDNLDHLTRHPELIQEFSLSAHGGAGRRYLDRAEMASLLENNRETVRSFLANLDPRIVMRMKWEFDSGTRNGMRGAYDFISNTIRMLGTWKEAFGRIVQDARIPGPDGASLLEQMHRYYLAARRSYGEAKEAVYDRMRVSSRLVAMRTAVHEVFHYLEQYAHPEIQADLMRAHQEERANFFARPENKGWDMLFGDRSEVFLRLAGKSAGIVDPDVGLHAMRMIDENPEIFKSMGITVHREDDSSIIEGPGGLIMRTDRFGTRVYTPDKIYRFSDPSEFWAEAGADTLMGAGAMGDGTATERIGAYLNTPGGRKAMSGVHEFIGDVGSMLQTMGFNETRGMSEKNRALIRDVVQDAIGSGEFFHPESRDMTLHERKISEETGLTDRNDIWDWVMANNRTSAQLASAAQPRYENPRKPSNWQIAREGMDENLIESFGRVIQGIFSSDSLSDDTHRLGMMATPTILRTTSHLQSDAYFLEGSLPGDPGGRSKSVLDKAVLHEHRAEVERMLQAAADIKLGDWRTQGRTDDASFLNVFRTEIPDPSVKDGMMGYTVQVRSTDGKITNFMSDRTAQMWHYLETDGKGTVNLLRPDEVRALDHARDYLRTANDQLWDELAQIPGVDKGEMARMRKMNPGIWVMRRYTSVHDPKVRELHPQTYGMDLFPELQKEVTTNENLTSAEQEAMRYEALKDMARRPARPGDLIGKNMEQGRVKERTFLTLQEAMNYGYMSQYRNPIDAAIEGRRQMANLVLFRETLGNMEDMGLAVLASESNRLDKSKWLEYPMGGNGQSRTLLGLDYKRALLRPEEVNGILEGTMDPPPVKLYVRADTMPLMHSIFGKGLSSQGWYRKLSDLNAHLNPIQLFGVFHLGTTAGILNLGARTASAMSDLTQSLFTHYRDAGLPGKEAAARALFQMKNAHEAGDLWSSGRNLQGLLLEHAFKTHDQIEKSDHLSDVQKMLVMMSQSAGINGMRNPFTERQAKFLMNAALAKKTGYDHFTDYLNNPWQNAKAGLYGLESIMQVAQTGIMGGIVAKAKLGFVADNFGRFLARNYDMKEGWLKQARADLENPDSKLARFVLEVGDRADDVYGMANIRKLFMDPRAKDLITLITRAFTWHLGNNRLLLKGLDETLSAVPGVRQAYGKAKGLMGGKLIDPDAPRLGASFLAAHTATTMALNAGLFMLLGQLGASGFAWSDERQNADGLKKVALSMKDLIFPVMADSHGNSFRRFDNSQRRMHYGYAREWANLMSNPPQGLLDLVTKGRSPVWELGKNMTFAAAGKEKYPGLVYGDPNESKVLPYGLKQSLIEANEASQDGTFLDGLKGSAIRIGIEALNAPTPMSLGTFEKLEQRRSEEGEPVPFLIKALYPFGVRDVPWEEASE